MRRLAPILLVAAALLAAPGGAVAAGCEVLDDPAQRADCEARAQAREAARSEVDRRVDDARSDESGTANGRTAAWQDAIEESRGTDAGELLDLRLAAAIGGLAWFWLTLRHQRRRNHRARAGR
jgi:hypothetical protein